MMTFLGALLLASAAVPIPVPGACTVSGEADASDRARARRACETARVRFTDVLGVEAPALEIVLQDRPGYRVSDVGQAAMVFWPTSAALAAAAGGVASMSAEAQWREVLPHEAMHALVATHFFPPGDDRTAAYGTPLADWFEEAVAIWAEPVTSRRTRMAQARNLPPAWRDLGAILTSEHPAARNPALLAARDGAVLPRDDRALWAFYPQALAVLAFVHDAGGAAAVRALAERLLAWPRDAAVLVGLPGLPADDAGVRAAWARWLAGSAASPSLDADGDVAADPAP